MQDPSTYFNQFPEQEILKCPRCDSSNTKFCYYNNYNLSQPRHFCKNCKRYWTKGGTLRNIPVGGATRKITKRSSSSSSSTPKRPTPVTTPTAAPDSVTNKNQQQLVGSSSSPASYLIENRMGFEQMGELGGGDRRLDSDPKVVSEERFGGVESGEMDCWSGSSNNDWPDLSIYTPRGSSFQ